MICQELSCPGQWCEMADRMLCVTAREFAEIHALERRCMKPSDEPPFALACDEAEWEDGLRLILGNSVVDGLKPFWGPERPLHLVVSEWQKEQRYLS